MRVTPAECIKLWQRTDGRMKRTEENFHQQLIKGSRTMATCWSAILILSSWALRTRKGNLMWQRAKVLHLKLSCDLWNDEDIILLCCHRTSEIEVQTNSSLMLCWLGLKKFRVLYKTPQKGLKNKDSKIMINYSHCENRFNMTDVCPSLIENRKKIFRYNR